jgi:SAM-dependent methyltransferase
MKPEEYQVMYDVEDTHWWYVGMRSIFLSLLDGHYGAGTDLKILDAGCGTGAMLSHLTPYGRVVGVDVSPEAIRLATSRDVEGCELVQSSVTDLPFDDEVFDLVTSFDVICCIDERGLAFRELSRVVRPEGRVILNLPAYNPLRSEHDVAVHIKKRYTRADVGEEMERVGLTVERIAHANTLLFPIEAAVRIAKKLPARSASEARSDLHGLPSAINRSLAQVLFLERWLLRKIDLPFGLSVICVARK